jgi:NADPH:quinone reductase-like Zn-dependent oxidoreductase
VIPLSDGAGEVDAIGDGVTRVKVGDRIAGCFHPRWFGGPIRRSHRRTPHPPRHGRMAAGEYGEPEYLAAFGRVPNTE